MDLKKNESNMLPEKTHKEDDAIENEIKEHLQNKTHIDKDHLNDWQRVEINIAIIGDDEANLTKNFLIKKLIGSYESQTKKSDVEITTEIETNATLQNPLSFAHSNNNKFQVWDLGALNSIEIKELKSKLFSKEFDNELVKYDFFILLTKQADKLSENENLFADKVESLNKKIYFVKSIEEKALVENEETLTQQDRLNIKNETSQLDKIETSKQIDKKKPLYLFSSDESKSNFQFLKLNENILNDLEKSEKFNSYVLTIEPLSETIIRKKTEVLRIRAYQIAILSSIFGYFLPIPGLTIAADLTLLAGEIIFYLKQFHLNKESIDNMTKKFKNAHYDLSKILAKSKYASLLLLEDIHALSGLLLKTIPLFAISSAVDIFKFIPIMGYMLKGTVSYETTKYTLMNILDEFSRVAVDIHNFIKDQNSMERKYAHLIDRPKSTIKNS